MFDDGLLADLHHAFCRVLDSGTFVSAGEVAGFETALASRLGVNHVAGVSSGTAALSLILRAAGVGPGDEVVLPANTFFATAEAVMSVQATPVFADADVTTASVDPESVAAAITPRTSAIIAVHMYGTPAAMPQLAAIANRHQLLLVEDAAQAFGAWCDGRPVGSLGDAAAMSFFPTKNLGALGEAGAVTTNDAWLADRVRRLRDHGQSEKHHHVESGGNERLDELQAAFLTVKLAHFDRSLVSRDRLASRYLRQLQAIPGVSILEVPGDVRAAYHLMVVRVDHRDAVLTRLRASGIGAAVHYPTPVHLQPACRYLGVAEGALPGCERLARTVLSLPFYPEMTDAQLDRCVRGLANAIVVS
ncbi:MAG TPA: DegT/DnrJ/EryC1/StrS family aminotransferase [Acidimicrobiales bacterium]|jgi:dTDP-4-amino-4,6-dideoxygalactose transaminase|nr:DegT/DnrJ/EryC1/StrS family aminotransferase [Acidimicrobiales bacterium]